MLPAMYPSVYHPTHTSYTYSCKLLTSLPHPLSSISPLPLTHYSQKNGSNALMFASQNGHSRVVQVLIKADRSADHLNAKRQEGYTALAFAIEADKLTCEALLRAAGAKKDPPKPRPSAPKSTP